MVIQKSIKLSPKSRGVYLISDEITPHIKDLKSGLANIFLKHTSASLAINENYDPSVRYDIETFLRSLIPDAWSGFSHTLEGDDDMSAHMKNIFIGSSLTIPIQNYKLSLGTWQGIYLLEHRDGVFQREIVLTLLS